MIGATARLGQVLWNEPFDDDDVQPLTVETAVFLVDADFPKTT